MSVIATTLVGHRLHVVNLRLLGGNLGLILLELLHHTVEILVILSPMPIDEVVQGAN